MQFLRLPPERRRGVSLASGLKDTRHMGAEVLPTCFDADHRLLDHILADVEFLADRRSFQAAGGRFAEVRRLVEGHLKDEEEILLPLYEERTRDPRRIVPKVRA